MATKPSTATAAPEEKTLNAEELRELKYAESLLDGEQTHLRALYHHYIHNLLKHTPRNSSTGFLIASHLELNKEGFDGDVKFPAKAASRKTPAYPVKDVAKGKVSEEDWNTLQTYFARFKDPVEIPEDDSVFKNLIRLTDILGLSEEEKKPLSLLYVSKRYEELGELIRTVFSDDLRKAAIGIARMLDKPLEGRKYLSALSFGSRLDRYGLTYFEDVGPVTESGLPVIDDEILERFDQPLSDDEIAAVLLGKPMVSQLGVEDFSHVGDQLDFVLKLVKKSVDSGEKGINIFLHGPAGSGKTELAGALAKHLGLRLFSVGEPDQDDMSSYTASGSKRPASEVRVSQLLRTQALLDGSKNSLVLFDEIEDLLMKGTDSSKSADTDNKLQVNRLLETNPVVTIWTGNNPEKFHEAVRQRFSYSILMDYPPTLVREKVWKRRLEMEKVSLPAEDIRTLAREYAAPARMISKAVRTMRIVDGDIDVIRRSLEADSKIAFGQTDGILVDDCIPKEFTLDFLNADENLHEMFNRLVARGVEKKPFSLLLRADQDTGAEHFLRSMAEEMVMNPYEISFASLCAPHPMMPPEQKFRMAFEGAVDARQFLIVSGLEDLGGDDGEMQADWKGGYVELFASYAMKHKVPFAVTARRDLQLPENIEMLFSDTVRMRAMTTDQATALYSRVFGHDLPEGQKERLSGLTAEDFLKTRSFLVRVQESGAFDHDRVIQMLHQFQQRRQPERAMRVGFNS